MPAVNDRNLPPILPYCPTCAKEMVFTSVTPTCGGAIYGYRCDSDGDRLSWQPRQYRERSSAPTSEKNRPTKSGGIVFG